jgi:hypothetical protein
LHCLSLAQVVSILDKEVDKHADAQGAEYLESFTGRRKRLTLEDVKRIDKRRAREARPEANDVTAVQQLLARLQELGENNPVLFHQEQRLDPAGDIVQDFVLVVADQFGLKMLEGFGCGPARAVLLDATGGTNKYGYQLHCLLVVDEYREGVPCAFMLTSGQDAAVVQKFLEVSSTQVQYEWSPVVWLCCQRVTRNPRASNCADCWKIGACTRVSVWTAEWAASD